MFSNCFLHLLVEQQALPFRDPKLHMDLGGSILVVAYLR